jgi:hypothetical protein
METLAGLPIRETMEVSATIKFLDGAGAGAGLQALLICGILGSVVKPFVVECQEDLLI